MSYSSCALFGYFLNKIVVGSTLKQWPCMIGCVYVCDIEDTVCIACL
uniref:Uncharacterized protein n=1 Tax=Arundo donax TaxID=35708 RepID=A0A0A9AHY4_ARUDO